MTEEDKKLLKMLDRIIHDHVVVMQAAEVAMQWIHNELAGPGLIPEDDEDFIDNAQAWYDLNRSEPFPRCWCGMPSNILSEGKGFCCDDHQRAGCSIFTMPNQ